MAAGFVSVPVIPTFRGMSKEFAERLEKPAKASGERAGKAMSQGMESAVENLERQVRASSSKLKDLDRAYEKSASKQAAQKEKLEAATLKLQDAEDKYQAALEKGDKGVAELAKVKEAKARVIGETEKLEQAEIDVRVAEEKHQDQLEDLNSTLAKLQDSQSDLNRELEKSSGAFGSAKDRIQSMADSAKNGAAKFGEFAQKYKFHASAALGGIGLIAKQSMEYASEAEQSYGAVESIFADHAQGIIDNSRRAATEVGVSGREYRELSASMGAMLKNMGMPMDEVADKSENLVGVSADLAATFGGSTKEAVEAVSSLLRGETDPIERYGVSIKQADINARMAADGLDGLTGEAEKQAKAQTLLKLLTEQTASAQGQFARETDTAAHKQQVATAKYKDAKEAIGTFLLPLMAEFAEKAANVAKVVGEHPAIFIAVAGAVGTLSAAIVGAATIAPILTAWSAAATAAGTSMIGLAASTVAAIAPIAAVVAAVAAVGVALWAFFTKTEVGRDLWDKFVGALQAGWDWISGVFAAGWDWLAQKVVAAFTTVSEWTGTFLTFMQENFWPVVESILGFVGDAFTSLWEGLSWAWESIIQPVFNGILELAKITLGVIATVILAPLLIAWNLLSSAIQWAWENVIQPVWQALADFSMNTLWPALQSVFQWIGDKWNWLSDTLSTVWGWIRDNVLNSMVAFFQNTLWPAIQSVIDWIADKWNWLYGILLNIWNWLNENVIQRQIRGFHRIWEAVLSVAGWIADKWQWMSDRLHAGWVWVDENVLGPFKRGLDVLKGWFRTTVDNIGRIWDGIKEKTKAPVQFVVDVVYNGGIRKAWNAVAGLVGLDELKEITFATGGILPGYTPGRDPYTFVEPRTGMRIGLSGGEAIMRPEATRVLGSAWVDGVNAAARVGGEAGVADYLYGDEKKRSLGGFYSGGVIGSITDWVHKYYPMMTITSTLRNSNDYHGQGLAVDFSNSTDSTPEMRSAAQNLFSNYGKGLLELIHSPFNHNVKHGKDVGDGFGFYGAGTMNAHRNHVHVASQQPLGDPKNMVEMVWDGAKAVFTSIKDRVTGLFNPIIDAVKGKLDSFSAPGIIGGLPEAMFKTLWGAAKDFIMGKADEASSYSGAAGSAGNAESWREMAMAAMRRQGFNADDPAQVNAMLAQIMSESGGDPGIAQQIVDINGTGDSAGVGLLQIIPGTFAAHRDPELPDDRRDPWANMNAALRYYKSRYGNDLTVMWGHGHGYAAGGVIPSLASLLQLGVYDTGGVLPHGAGAVNLSGRPEVVINGPQLAAINNLANNVGALVGQLAATGDVDAFIAGLEKTVGPQVAVIAEQVTSLADPESVAGVAARTAAREVAEIAATLGAEYVPKTVTVLLDAEKSLYDAREKHAERVAGLEEKTTALTEAQKRLAELQNGSVEESTESAEKLAEAEKRLEDARADGDTDKVEEAEKNLADVRKASAEDVKKAEQERADNIEKATEDVKKAEADLADARREHARNLDMTVYEVMPGLYDGLMQAAAGAGQFSGQVAAVAAAVGPAGMSIGMMVETVKTAINVVKSLVEMILDIVERVFQARLEARKGLADAMATVAEYAKLLSELQADVSKLQQEVVRGVNEQRTAMFNLQVAIHDRLVAEAEGYVAVTEARLKLDAELERGARIAQLRMMGLHEDWDTYLSYRAQVAGDALAVWSDVAITALYQYEAARATALKGELSARLKQIEAEAALAEATRKNARNQADLLTMQERLIRMSAEVAGVDLPGAVGGKQASALLVELFELERAMKKNVFGRWGYQLGDDSSYAMAYKGQVERKRSIEAALAAVLDEAGVSISESTKQAMFKRMEKVAWRKGDVADVVRAYLPEVAKAEAALKMHDSLSPIWEAQDKMRDQEREVEDFRAEMDLFEKTHPLEETIKGLEYAIAGLTSTADAFGEESEEMRAARLRLARANLTAASHHGVDWKVDDRFEGGARVVKEVTVHMDGAHVYTADEVDKLLAEVTSGSNVSVRTSWSASTVAGARRKERV